LLKNIYNLRLKDSHEVGKGLKPIYDGHKEKGGRVMTEEETAVEQEKRKIKNR
jgi:hypothetical protein